MPSKSTKVQSARPTRESRAKPAQTRRKDVTIDVMEEDEDDDEHVSIDEAGGESSSQGIETETVTKFLQVLKSQNKASAAKAFQAKTRVLFDDARARAENLQIEHASDRQETIDALNELRNQETEIRIKAFARLFGTRNRDHLIPQSNLFVEDIEAVSSTMETHVENAVDAVARTDRARKKTWKRSKKDAQAGILAQIEMHEVVTNASEYITHYSSILRV